jgi:transposase-like protein
VAVGYESRFDRAGGAKLRRGVDSPEFLLQPTDRTSSGVGGLCGRRGGVSTRRVDDLVKATGIDGISKSEVSPMAQELDQVVTEL